MTEINDTAELTATEAPIGDIESTATEVAPVRESRGPDAHGWFRGTGRRKTAVARVRLKPGSGEFQIRGRGSRSRSTSTSPRPVTSTRSVACSRTPTPKARSTSSSTAAVADSWARPRDRPRPRPSPPRARPEPRGHSSREQLPHAGRPKGRTQEVRPGRCSSPLPVLQPLEPESTPNHPPRHVFDVSRVSFVDPGSFVLTSGRGRSPSARRCTPRVRSRSGNWVSHHSTRRPEIQGLPAPARACLACIAANPACRATPPRSLGPERLHQRSTPSSRRTDRGTLEASPPASKVSGCLALRLRRSAPRRRLPRFGGRPRVPRPREIVTGRVESDRTRSPRPASRIAATRGPAPDEPPECVPVVDRATAPISEDPPEDRRRRSAPGAAPTTGDRSRSDPGVARPETAPPPPPARCRSPRSPDGLDRGRSAWRRCGHGRPRRIRGPGARESVPTTDRASQPRAPEAGRRSTPPP